MLKSSIIILYLVVFTISTVSQEKVFYEKEFIEILITNHPIAKKINLIKLKNLQQLKYAKGNFDPKLTSENSQKVFSNKEYYLISQNILTIPTWYGIDVKAGFDIAKGIYSPSEIITPEAGLAQLGLNIPILQGLFYDKRRNEVQKAENINFTSQYELVKEYNELLKNALNDYWIWFLNYKKMNIYLKALNINKFRFEGIKSAFIGGDAAAIDTLEALMQVHSIQSELQIVRQEYENSKLILSNYLWNEKNIPIEISSNTIPDTVIKELSKDLKFAKQIDSLVDNNPEYQLYLIKRKNTELDKDLYLELIKPKLNLKLNVLNTGFYSSLSNSLNLNYFQNNYKIGMDFEMPLYLRKELSILELTDIKISELDYMIAYKKLELKNKILSCINKYNTLAENNNLYSKLIVNSSTLLSAEETRFQIGESSLFLVNTRQQKLIESEIKFVDNYTKSKIGYIELLYNIGNTILYYQ